MEGRVIRDWPGCGDAVWPRLVDSLGLLSYIGRLGKDGWVVFVWRTGGSFQA